MRINSIDQLETAMNYLQQKKAQMAELTAAANKEIAQVRDRTLQNVGNLEEEVARLEGSILRFAESIRDDEEIFAGGKKSLDLHAGVIGFKLGKPSITLREGWSEADAVEALAAARMHSCITKKEDTKLDKSQLMKQYNAGKLDDKQLKEFGLQVKQDESFFIDLKTVDKAVA